MEGKGRGEVGKERGERGEVGYAWKRKARYVFKQLADAGEEESRPHASSVFSDYFLKPFRARCQIVQGSYVGVLYRKRFIIVVHTLRTSDLISLANVPGK